MVKTLYSVHALIMERMTQVLARDATHPERQKARDEVAVLQFMDAAIIGPNALGKGEAVTAAVEAFDVENIPPRPIALFTRYALTASNSADFGCKLERLQNIPG